MAWQLRAPNHLLGGSNICLKESKELKQTSSISILLRPFCLTALFYVFNWTISYPKLVRGAQQIQQNTTWARFDIDFPSRSRSFIDLVGRKEVEPINWWRGSLINLFPITIRIGKTTNALKLLSFTSLNAKSKRSAVVMDARASELGTWMDNIRLIRWLIYGSA